MGHYRSEMGYEAQDEAERREKERRRERMVVRIREAIREEGVEGVIADLLLDGPIMSKVRYDR